MANKIKLRLQGHEKFSLREGWLNKGLTAVHENSTVFLGKDAPDIFGIGNNMVKSLRYWLKAFDLIEEKASEGAKLSTLGEIIFDKDPYFEREFTLWVLHSHIVKNIEVATTWYMYFNRCDADELDKDQIEFILLREVTKYASGQNFSAKSLKSDVDVLLNMYSKNREMYDPEDKNVSPFSQLGLVRCLEGRYVKTHPDRRIISEWNVLYELSIMMEGQDSISIEKVTYGEKSVGNIYHLTMIAINEMLDKLDALGYINVDRTAGLDMIYKAKKFTPESVMDDYYNKVK